MPDAADRALATYILLLDARGEACAGSLASIRTIVAGWDDASSGATPDAE